MVPLKLVNKGFSLVEILVAIGLLGGLSALIMNLMSQSSKTSSKFQSDIEATTITAEIMGHLADPQVCSHASNLGGKNTTGLPGADLNIGLSSIRKKNGTFIYSTAGGPYGGGSLFIDSYRLQDTAGDDVITTAIPREVYLVINFKKKLINQTTGSTTFQRKIKISYLTTVGDTTRIIASCKATSTASDSVWTRGTGANINDIYYNDGNVGVGTTAPSAKLDVGGTIRPGAAVLGAVCTALGAQGYNSVTGAPIYCNGAVWTAVGVEGWSSTGAVGQTCNTLSYTALVTSPAITTDGVSLYQIQGLVNNWFLAPVFPLTPPSDNSVTFRIRRVGTPGGSFPLTIKGKYAGGSIGQIPAVIVWNTTPPAGTHTYVLEFICLLASPITGVGANGSVISIFGIKSL